MNLAGVLAAALVAVGVANDVDASEFRYTRPVAASSGGPVRIDPDATMYGHARIDFADLRVVDTDGNQVPWRFEPLPDAVAPQSAPLVARGVLDGVVSVVLDRGATAEVIDRIELDVPDRDFVGEVEVLGSSTGAEGTYARLSTTPIYAVHGAVDARSTTALFPPTDYRYLLVRARGVSAIARATVARDPLRPGLEPVAADSTVEEQQRATVVTLDLGFANVPVDAIDMAAATDRFVRRVAVDGSNDRVTFTPIGGGQVARFRGVDLDRIAIDSRYRYVRVTIENGDDTALEGLQVQALSRPRPLLLAEGFEPPFRLYYGSARVTAPAYDFEELPTGAIGLQRAVAGSLGAERQNPAFEPPADARTFFERNGGVVNGLLVAAAIVVAVGGFLALRRRTEPG